MSDDTKANEVLRAINDAERAGHRISPTELALRFGESWPSFGSVLFPLENAGWVGGETLRAGTDEQRRELYLTEAGRDWAELTGGAEGAPTDV